MAEDLYREAMPQTREALLAAIARLHSVGLMTAPLPLALGGLGLGTEPGGHLALLRCLTALGSADLPLGRVVEGHLNALILIHAYGSAEQLQRAAHDAERGLLFGVWNTGDATPMRVHESAEGLHLEGSKTFATGAGFVDRPLLTAERQGWQMVLPRMEASSVQSAIQLHREAWQPYGMESSESLTIDFTGAQITLDDLIGQPADFYQDPLFRGGAVRFAAVQAGAVLRLLRSFTDWVTLRGRQSDPYQLARLGELELLAQGAVLWIERAAVLAETALWATTRDPQSIRQMVRCGNMTRLAVERAATAAIGFIVPGVGAHGLLRPARFERTLRDLTMYLRQPNPDGALADVGRSALLDELPHYWGPPTREPAPSYDGDHESGAPAIS